jgi:SAM-dependent methyltransferase
MSKFNRYGRFYDWYLRNWIPINKQASILDIGCGYGQLLRFFSKRGYSNVIGVDISSEQVEFAKKVHPNVIQANALEFLEQHIGQFDLIVAIDLVEHFTKEEMVLFLDASYQSLKPKGQLIIQTPNADSPFALVHGFGDFTHELCLNINALKGIMTVCGFNEVEGRETGPIPFGLFSFVRLVLWKLIRFAIIAYNVIETGGSGSGIFTRVFISRGVRQ